MLSVSNMSRTNKLDRPGMVLLVVLGMLTFFSILIASFLVFANQSRQSSFVIASRNVRSIDTRAVIDEALMTLIRGTDDPFDPFYGEDLLSDFYGRFDSLNLQVGNATPAPTRFLGQRFARFPVQMPVGVNVLDLDDQFANRIATITNGASGLRGTSMRVLRSKFESPFHYLYVELPISIAEARPDLMDDARMDFFFPPGSTVRLNGVPRNSPGIGFDGTDFVNATLQASPYPGLELPKALQPNALGRQIEKVRLDPMTGLPATEQGDFDESYDASDFNNWYLSFRDSQGKITPSFHRPAVINYILNDSSLSGSLAAPTVRGNILVSLARATFRPLPLSIGNINTRFTGSNSSYALRTPIVLPDGNDDAVRFRLNQLAKALIGDHGPAATLLDKNPWDVDNDGDGIPDSIWVDLGLPTIVSQEGKLLRPLVAPMIEDLSARLNLNAHGNYYLPDSVSIGGTHGQALWANARVPFANVPFNDPGARTFRGIGYGPAEISIPMLPNAEWKQDRYQNGRQTSVAFPNVGVNGRDAFDLVRNGWRSPIHGANTGYGYSMDPFGRAGVGLGRDGSVLMANSGLEIPAAVGGGNDAVNNPYEADPSGRLAGDSHFTFEELEPILRSKSFDLEMLPPRLRRHVQSVLDSYPEMEKGFTTYNVSDDTPVPVDYRLSNRLTILQSVVGWLNMPSLDNQGVRELIAPELRLGRKLDVNRPFGNGIDDNGNQVKDEPIEAFVEVATGAAFGVHPNAGGTLPTSYQGTVPDYAFDTPPPNSTPPAPPPATQPSTPGWFKEDSRSLLARHLYVLMMGAARNIEFPSFDPAIALTAAEQEAYRARRIAQWAVNVVDFRDADAINTRFVYDPNPFDGWDVRYRIVDAAGTPVDRVVGDPLRSPPPPVYSPEVWGVEQPELIFSESMAFHDVRVRDTNLDSTNRTKRDRDPDDFANWDLNTDQVRIPQGSLFLELYCPRTTVEPTGFDQVSKQGFPRELYKYFDESDQSSPATLALDLATTAPGGVPVWRIAISKPHPNSEWTNVPPESLNSLVGNTTIDPHDLWKSPVPPAVPPARPSTTSFDPARPDEIDNTAPPVLIDRYIWFRSFGQPAEIANLINTAQISDMNPAQVFFTPNTVTTNFDARLAPGQYLTVAPRAETNFGSTVFAGTVPNRPSRHRFSVVAGEGAIHFNEANTRLTPLLGFAAPANFTPAKPLIVGTFPPDATWANVFSTNADENYVGLNVSEPLPFDGPGYTGGPYYASPPTFRYGGNANANYPLTDSYVDFAAQGTALNEPLDLTTLYIPVTEVEVRNPDPNANDVRQAREPFIGTLPRYCSAFLQRLADPLRPYNDITNPYITVDYIPIDLTVFSGEENPYSADPDIAKVSPTPVSFFSRSRQRNGKVEPAATVSRNELFSYETNTEALVPAGLLGATYFSVGNEGHLYSSFNFLNTLFPIDPTVSPDPVNPGFVGFAPSIGQEGLDNSPGVVGHDRNLPQIPFAKASWLNRPFASHLELMLVPASSSGRLFAEFSTADITTDPFVYSNGAADPNALPRFVGPFRHLLNFFHGDVREGTESGELMQFFNFVGTLPRFRGEVDMITPARVTGLPSPPGGAEGEWLGRMFQSPFNFRYDNLRHGRINLNTVSSFQVWRGLMQGHMNDDEFQPAPNPNPNPSQLSFENFLTNRRGFNVTTGDPTEIGSAPVNFDPSRFNPEYPTEFAAPYREHADGRLAPSLRNSNDRLKIANVNSTMLRRNERIVDAPTPPGEDAPFFVRSREEQPSNVPRQDRMRDAFIRYQTLTRMPNLASNNSQTFVVWITVGLFEVDAQTNSLGREYNEDLGKNERFQAMFIIDRSIPVGFEPGKDLNARDVVVFEKYFQ